MQTRSGISAELCKRHTLLDVTSKATPSGINATPTANSTGRTVPAVMIGCHAGSFCCLNFVSVHIITRVKQLNHTTRVQAVTCQLHADDNCIGRGATRLVIIVNVGEFSACTDIHLESYDSSGCCCQHNTLQAVDIQAYTDGETLLHDPSSSDPGQLCGVDRIWQPTP